MKVKVYNSQTLNELKELNLAIATRIDGECMIGRSPNSGLFLDSPDVSRLHGKFFLQDEKYYFSDLGSINGSIVNGKSAEVNQSYALRAGDVIRMGEFVLIMEQISELPEDLPATVIGGIDATVISGWHSPSVSKPKSPVDSDTPKVTNQAHTEVSEVAEPVTPAPEVALDEITGTPTSEVVSGVPEAVIQPPQAPEVSEPVTHRPEAEAMSQAPESVLDETTDTPTTEPLSDVSEPVGSDTAVSSTLIPETEVIGIPRPEPVEASDAIHNQAPDISLPELVEVSEDSDVWAAEDTEATDVATTEPVSEVPEATRSDVPILGVSDSPTPEIVSQPPEPVTPVPHEVPGVAEVSEVTYVPTPDEASEELTYVQPVEAISQTPEAPEAPEEELTYVQAPDVVSEVPEAVVPAPLEVPEVTNVPVTETVVASEAIAQPPEEISELPETISKKYIALMAHDSKKSDLVQLVAQHEDLFSKCLTIATPSVSQTLYQQTGIATSRQTPTVPVGGYQAVASLLGAGDILAVIFLRDLLVVQGSQSNEDALLRLCNVNQVLFATNIPTAEAILHYIKDIVMSS